MASFVWPGAPFRYSTAHEDSVRVLIIYNDKAEGSWYCPESTKWPGLKGRDFVREAISGVSHIKSVKSSEVSWDSVASAWAPLLPHVIVHINAGWYTLDAATVPGIMVQAANNGIGLVEVGDDAAAIGKDVFGFTNVTNNPGWILEGVDHGDWRTYEPVWFLLDDSLDVPQGYGIITNARKLMNSDTLFLKSFGEEDGRCHADADWYNVGPGNWEMLTFMAWQYAKTTSPIPKTGSYIAGEPKLYASIGAFGNGTRRGAALSFQPNEIVNRYASEQIVYDAVMWASFARQGFDLPAPVADPGSKTFEFFEEVRLRCAMEGVDIYYRLNSGEFLKYDGTPLRIVATALLEAYAAKDGILNSDTVSEVYSKVPHNSSLECSKISMEPLGGYSLLTEADSQFVVTLTTTYASLDSVKISVQTVSGKDAELPVITNPVNTGEALVFVDTVLFAVRTADTLNGFVEAGPYDSVRVNWINPVNNEDSLSVSFAVRPAPNIGNLYFADSNWQQIALLTGSESLLYVVLEDQVFDSARLSEYVVTLSNSKGLGNTSFPDRETYPFIELSPGKYGVEVPVNLSVPSPPVEKENGVFEIRVGDDLKAGYLDPVDLMAAGDSKGFGVPNQQPGRVVFTNADYSTPVQLSSGGTWDIASGNIYLLYQDDFVSAITQKPALITITSTDWFGNHFIDRETVNLVFREQQADIGIWGAALPLTDRLPVRSGDGRLQFYFSAAVSVNIATHKSGIAAVPAGDTVSTIIKVAARNHGEKIIITDAENGNAVSRFTVQVSVCVEDQDFSINAVDTVLLDKVECEHSGDLLNDLRLVQSSDTSALYCAVFPKGEASAGSIADNKLHCQDVDYLAAFYTDPVYGTKARKVAAIYDTTTLVIGFFDLSGKALSAVSEKYSEQVLIRLRHKTISLNKADTLTVVFRTDSGDTLDLQVVETAPASGIFEAVMNIGFSEKPDFKDNRLDGKLDVTNRYNTARIAGEIDGASVSLTMEAAYIPPDRAWIVDGNGDGQGDSVYISFLGVPDRVPLTVSSIDWPREGFQEYTAEADTAVPLNSDINYAFNRFSVISAVIPGVLDTGLKIFPVGATYKDNDNPPSLILPDNKYFRGREVDIEDGIGAIVTAAIKRPSDNRFYQAGRGAMQKTPDTLEIHLSEKIRALHNVGNPWDSLFCFSPPGQGYSVFYPLQSLPGVKPQVRGTDSLVWIFIVDNSLKTKKPLVDDELFMNPNASYTDASAMKNRPQAIRKIIKGADYVNVITASNVFVPVAGLAADNPKFLAVNVYREEDGEVFPGRNLHSVKNISGSYTRQQMWVPPVGLGEDGTVKALVSDCMPGKPETVKAEVFPANCLTAVQVFSTDAYRADITIFDQLGKYVHGSIQSFGDCGEQNNPDRRTGKGMQSWLVWNQKDLDGHFVGTGVYFWRVVFTSGGRKHIAVYRQGILRMEHDPDNSCAK
ncbi:MAG: hypothetical protein HQK83_13105 [Fibrobacteria bacterium]|nr:hypothetical protein [Fibrobacteria bacterium]